MAQRAVAELLAAAAAIGGVVVWLSKMFTNVFNDGFGPSDQYVREFLTTLAPRMPPAAFRASRFQSHPPHTHHLSSLLLVELVFTNCPFTRGLASASCFLEAYLIFLL